MALDPANLEPLCTEVNERIWSVKKNHWLTMEEMTEILNEGFQFRLFFSPFQEKMASCTDSSEQMLTFLLGLFWCCSQDKISKPVTGLIEYLLFAFPSIAKHFNQEDELMIVPPDGSIRRVIGATYGPILMKGSFWKRVGAKWKEDYPHMFSDSDEESEDAASPDETLQVNQRPNKRMQRRPRSKSRKTS